MTPERKAKLLYGKMLNECGIHSEAVKCAMIAVDEIIDVLNSYTLHMEWGNDEMNTSPEYWQSVKEELQKI